MSDGCCGGGQRCDAGQGGGVAVADLPQPGLKPPFDLVPGGGLRRFHLLRKRDVTGVSGTGTVAEGVEFTSGMVVIQWLSTVSSMSMWPSLEMAMSVHGHDGCTVMQWVDEVGS